MKSSKEKLKEEIVQEIDAIYGGNVAGKMIYCLEAATARDIERNLLNFMKGLLNSQFSSEGDKDDKKRV